MSTATPISSLLIVGAGRVAFHLATELLKHDRAFSVHVFARNVPEDLSQWPQGIYWHHQWNEIPSIDLVVLAVSDSAIRDVAAQGAAMHTLKTALWVHTSGATSTEAFKGLLPRYGLFYPLQSFSKSVGVHWPDIPIGIDAALGSDVAVLQSLAKMLGASTFTLHEDQRQRLHLAAVFANNFTNHCLGIAADIMEKSGLNFDLLRPLIQLTFQKALGQHPFDAQTGPAIRGDVNTIEQHKKLLKENFDTYLKMYESITQQIQVTHSSEK